MPEESSVNPYTPPETAELSRAQSVIVTSFPRRLLFLVLVFVILRGVASGFATLILLVHLSGTPIHWRNATPLLAVTLIGCLLLHYVEWKVRVRTWLVLIFAIFGYLIGTVVVTVAGLLDLFHPNPF